MSNPIKLPLNFADFDFATMAKKESNARNRLRLIAMANIQEGKTLQEISSSLKIHWKTIQTWLAQFRKGGIDNLYVKAKKNKPKKIDAKIDSWIKKFIDALNMDNEGGYITGKQYGGLILLDRKTAF